MTGQDLLDRMELVNQELQLQSGETDVARGLIALNVAQDYFEQLAAIRKGTLGGQTGIILTANGTETTAFPAGFLRIDRLQVLDATTNRPSIELKRLQRTGGHATTAFWPLNIVNSSASGTPYGYWTNGTNIYWQPLPNGVNTIRVYGFKRASDITASGTFAYDDGVAFPLSSFAVRLMKTGVDDPANDVAGLAQETFKSILDTLSNFNRDGQADFEYTQVHTS
jgi:hypothetical protein